MVRLAREKVRVRLLGDGISERSYFLLLVARTGLPVEQAENVYPLKLYCPYCRAGGGGEVSSYPFSTFKVVKGSVRWTLLIPPTKNLRGWRRFEKRSGW